VNEGAGLRAAAMKRGFSISVPAPDMNSFHTRHLLIGKLFLQFTNLGIRRDKIDVSVCSRTGRAISETELVCASACGTTYFVCAIDWDRS
jgi:hypothetical protein